MDGTTGTTTSETENRVLTQAQTHLFHSVWECPNTSLSSGKKSSGGDSCSYSLSLLACNYGLCNFLSQHSDYQTKEMIIMWHGGAIFFESVLAFSSSVDLFRNAEYCAPFFCCACVSMWMHRPFRLQTCQRSGMLSLRERDRERERKHLRLPQSVPHVWFLVILPLLESL